MERYGLYNTFAATMTDEEMKKSIPKAAETLLTELFDACKENGLRPKMETLEIIYKHKGAHDGPFGSQIVDENGDLKFIRATLAVKIETEKRGEETHG